VRKNTKRAAANDDRWFLLPRERERRCPAFRWVFVVGHWPLLAKQGIEPVSSPGHLGPTRFVFWRVKLPLEPASPFHTLKMNSGYLPAHFTLKKMISGPTLDAVYFM